MTFCRARWGYHSASGKLAGEGEESVCANSEERKEEQMGPEQELQRTQQYQQGLPASQGRACTYIRTKAAVQSITFGWRKPPGWEMKRRSGLRSYKQTSAKPPLAREVRYIAKFGIKTSQKRHMANEVQGTSVCVYKMPSKGQEIRHTANYPDVNPKIRASSMSSNHSSDVLPGGKKVDGVGSWLQTLPSCTMQSPGAFMSLQSLNPPWETLMHLAWSQADWPKPFLKALRTIPTCVFGEKLV